MVILFLLCFSSSSCAQAKSNKEADRNAVRPGLMSLRSRKLHWTMDELMQIEAGYTFKIQRQERAVCQGVSLDRDMCQNFQQYLRQVGFNKTRRCAWLYGRYVEKLEQSKVDEEAGPAVDSFGKPLKVRVRAKGYGGQTTTQVQVDCSYEPPQRCTAETMELLADPHEELVQQVAASLGLERVGFMFSHPGPREEGHHFSANEIIMAAENQLLAGDEKMQSPFVTVKVTLNEENNSDFQACQMSRQCLELVAEGALLNDPQEPRACLVHDTFSCLVQGERKKGGKKEGRSVVWGVVVIVCGGGGCWCVFVCVCLCVFLFVGGLQLLFVGVGQVKTNHRQNQASSLTPLPSFPPLPSALVDYDWPQQKKSAVSKTISFWRGCPSWTTKPRI